MGYNNAEDDQRTTKQKAINDWLPVTASRTAKWWYSAFHNVTAYMAQNNCSDHGDRWEVITEGSVEDALAVLMG
ncbi:hypothetical protein FRX31_011381 [Thalictrum thalictroides]|uniref:Uncharacterized protein n=1 Tax=Thalictrum thalictroides TaxID=46969 RepID=A0A7J6WPZ4_THATH|nr:hypothetical protein FRX31_011381 [Thalictrum thalictroides]